MKSVFISLKHLHTFLEEFGAYKAILLALCAAILYLLFTLLKNGRKSVKVNKLVSILFFSFSLASILQITLIGRIGKHYDGWSKMMDDWNIFESTNLISSPQVRNTALFLLIMPSVFVLLKCFKGKVLSPKGMLICSVPTAFTLSLLVELCQGIFSIGTFQFSDLFYNTLGGIIGAIAYIIIIKIIEIIKQKSKR